MPAIRKQFRKVSAFGYVLLFKPDHPNAYSDGWIPEHRFVMSEFLKRPLLSTEVCHHKDGNRTNNAVGNLQICTQSEHTKIHFPRGKCKLCDGLHSAKGLCVVHYNRKRMKEIATPCVGCGKMVNKDWRRGGPPRCWRCAFPLNVKCKLCGKPQKCKNLCVNHYQQHIRKRHLRIKLILKK